MKRTCYNEDSLMGLASCPQNSEMKTMVMSCRLSPGGAADLLAVTVFLHLMERIVS